MYIQSTTTAANAYRTEFVFSADQWLCDTLISIGIFPNLAGYHHIRRAVKIVAEAKYRYDIGHVYDILADEFDHAASSIERTIRNAINCAYRADGLVLLNRIFNVEVVKSNNQMLSNTQLISLLAHYYNQKEYQLTHSTNSSIAT